MKNVTKKDRLAAVRNAESWTTLVRIAALTVGVITPYMYSETRKSGVSRIKVYRMATKSDMRVSRLVQLLTEMGGFAEKPEVVLSQEIMYSRQPQKNTIASVCVKYPAPLDKTSSLFKRAKIRLQNYIEEQPVTHLFKPVPKKEVLKCKPGTWLRLAWNDAPDSVALLVRRAARDEPGEVDLQCYYPSIGECHTRATSAQVVEILHTIEVPVIH